MVPQGAPKVQKESAQVPNWRHQASQMAAARSSKGLAAEGVDFKIKLQLLSYNKSAAARDKALEISHRNH